MKELKLEKMEKYVGGKISQRRCAVAGVAISLSVATMAWGVSLALVTMNADCF